MTSKKVSWQKQAKNLNPTTKVFIKTQFISAVLYSISFLIASAVGLLINISKSYAFYVCIFAFALSSFLCATYAGYKIHKNGISVGLLFCLPFNIIVLFTSIATNSFKIDLTAVISFLILIVSSMLGGIFSVNLRIKVKPRHR